jgi:hypothetical protein
MGKYLWSIMTTKEGSEEEAKKTMETTNRNCPYLVATGHTSNVVYSVYMVPEGMRWWLEYPEKMNRELGKEKYDVQIVENLMYPEDLTFKTPLPEKPPCGANCETCRLREQYDCDGCPATKSEKSEL